MKFLIISHSFFPWLVRLRVHRFPRGTHVRAIRHRSGIPLYRPAEFAVFYSSFFRPSQKKPLHIMTATRMRPRDRLPPRSTLGTALYLQRLVYAHAETYAKHAVQRIQSVQQKPTSSFQKMEKHFSLFSSGFIFLRKRMQMIAGQWVEKMFQTHSKITQPLGRETENLSFANLTHPLLTETAVHTHIHTCQ